MLKSYLKIAWRNLRKQKVFAAVSMAGIVAVAIAFLTVSMPSVKAALANPVDSLNRD